MKSPTPRVDSRRIRSVASTGNEREKRQLAEVISAAYENSRAHLNQSLDDPAVRRWARGYLLDQLAGERSAELAEQLLRWPEDYRADQRDRTTFEVVRYLPEPALEKNLDGLAGSNAASELWARLATTSADRLLEAARRVLRHGRVEARETTLHLLVLDPYGPELLDPDQQNELLRLALDDPDPEIRGLAAEVLAVESPELLLRRSDSAPHDTSERVRMAYWRTEFAHQPDLACERAALLVLDPENSLEPRRTALLALGEHESTRKISQVLIAVLSGEEEELAEDAAQLMWRHHRSPDIANAAAASRFSQVSDLADHLLHPERGSPAAGGSRPGDPTRTTGIYDQFLPRRDQADREPDDR